MFILIKFFLKNISEKKFRTFLIIFSIAISSALFFASNAISATMKQMPIEKMRQFYGNAEIIINANDKSHTPFFDIDKAKKLMGKGADYVIGEIMGIADLKTHDDKTVVLNLLGIDLEDLQKMNPVLMNRTYKLYPFEDKKLIISKSVAEKYGLTPGEDTELEINGRKYRFSICGIAEPAGVFADNGYTMYGVAPRNELAMIYNARGLANLASIKLKDPLQKKQVMEALSEEYSRYVVGEPFTQEEIKQQASTASTGYLMMSFLVTLISIFIIYTSFRVITMERLPYIGTFRSVGATKKMTNLILISESLIYGILGGTIGCLLGISIFSVMSLVTGSGQGVKAIVGFTPAQVLEAFVFAVAISLASSIIPILKVAKIPIKEIVLNSIEKQVVKNYWKYLLGFVFVVIGYVVPPLVPRQYAVFIDVACIFASISAMVMLIPLVTEVFIKVFEGLYAYIFGNEGILAAKNLRDNKNILNIISLLAIGISSLLMTNTLSDTVCGELSGIYNKATFDVWIFRMPNADRNFDRLLRGVDGVKDVYGIYETQNIEIEGAGSSKIKLLQGIDRNKFLDYWNIDMSENRQTLMEELDSGRNVILTNTLKEKLSLNKGDTITLKMKNANRSYKIIGFFNSIKNAGSIALISERNFKTDTGIRYYNNIYVKTSKDPAMVKQAIEERFTKENPFVMVEKDAAIMEQKSNSDAFTIIQAFCILTLVIGIFGVMNNLIINFIERKRSLAIYRSVGSNKRQIVKMLFIEAFSGGIVGGVMGVATGFIVIWAAQYAMEGVGLYVPIRYPVNTIHYYLLIGIVIFVTASISSAFKSSKLNIIEAIKYE